MSLCGMPPLCAQKGPAPAGINPSQYTSATGAINRLGIRQREAFLKWRIPRVLFAGVGTLKGRQGFGDILKLFSQNTGIWLML